VRSVYRDYDAKDKDHQPLAQQILVRYIDATGQLLFAPPNVKGWRGGKSWLNTSTVLARDNFAQQLAMGTLWSGGNGNLVAFDGVQQVVDVKPSAPADAKMAPT